LNEDLHFAQKVSIGDTDTCEKFVDEYTDLVISRVYSLMKTHCSQPARDYICTLLIIQRQRKGSSVFPVDQCDDCMESYVWFFEFLKGKLKAYQGKNNCSLKTFVWSIVNSHSTYIEWLRWRYGRAY